MFKKINFSLENLLGRRPNSLVHFWANLVKSKFVYIFCFKLIFAVARSHLKSIILLL